MRSSLITSRLLYAVSRWAICRWSLPGKISDYAFPNAVSETKSKRPGHLHSARHDPSQTGPGSSTQLARSEARYRRDSVRSVVRTSYATCLWQCARLRYHGNRARHLLQQGYRSQRYAQFVKIFTGSTDRHLGISGHD